MQLHFSWGPLNCMFVNSIFFPNKVLLKKQPYTAICTLLSKDTKKMWRGGPLTEVYPNANLMLEFYIVAMMSWLFINLQNCEINNLNKNNG